MALHARTAAAVPFLVAVLASPLAVEASSRRAGATQKTPRAAQNRARPQAPSGGAARTGAGEGQAERGSQIAWDHDAVVRWEDQDGTVHYTRGYEVPRRFRAKARQVHATVGTVPLDPDQTKQPTASLQGPTSAAALPALPLLPVIPLPSDRAPPPSTPGTQQGVPSGASLGSTTGARQTPPAAVVR